MDDMASIRARLDELCPAEWLPARAEYSRALLALVGGMATAEQTALVIEVATLKDKLYSPRDRASAESAGRFVVEQTAPERNF